MELSLRKGNDMLTFQEIFPNSNSSTVSLSNKLRLEKLKSSDLGSYRTEQGKAQ